MSEPQKTKRFDLPDDFTDGDREVASVLIRQRILERTANNLDYNGKRFANYSDSYSKSFEFKLAGKDKNDPNLRLTGDMLETLDVIESKKGYVILGYKEGTPENDKAVWAERSDNGPSRKFLGLTTEELNQVISEVRLTKGKGKDSVNNAFKENTTQKAINSIFKKLFGE